MNKKIKIAGILILLLLILGSIVFISFKLFSPKDETVVLWADNDMTVSKVTPESENSQIQSVRYENKINYADLGIEGASREKMESQHDTNMEEYKEMNDIEGVEAGVNYEEDYFVINSYYDLTVADIDDIIELDAAVSNEDDLKLKNYVKHLEELGFEEK
ncbi:DUF1307 domain-containing protein [Oceanobacillus timonensis]|uniref:DUF1307 domain-containing protein n=1 Tax=Oceanobacillus timonensis TaxID=1926285 RepID=UPI0009BC098A|nr:DUF1307 domain-containing protein [Oceanobacillus timonensis]